MLHEATLKSPDMKVLRKEWLALNYEGSIPRVWRLSYTRNGTPMFLH